MERKGKEWNGMGRKRKERKGSVSLNTEFSSPTDPQRRRKKTGKYQVPFVSHKVLDERRRGGRRDFQVSYKGKGEGGTSKYLIRGRVKGGFQVSYKEKGGLPSIL